jgi:hypothetical protein
MFFSYEHLKFRYEPFPIGFAKPLMEPGLYRELLANYPPVELFQNIPKLGSKYSLSERFNACQYKTWIRSQPLWRELHRWLKSPEFIRGVMSTLEAHHIELGYGIGETAGKVFLRKLKALARGRLSDCSPRLGARFEFSMLPADGGHILPHTDAPSKIVTLIVSIVDEGEWDPAFGGGTDVNRPKDVRLGFNQLNRQGRFEDMEVLDTFEFTPNQAVIFVKTFNSWHSVRPMKGVASPAMRKTLTINIETRS